MKSFVNRMINSLTIGPNKYRVALAQYSDDVHVEFQLDDFKAKNPMLAHIKKTLSFKGGTLRTGNAIQKVHEMFFEASMKDKNQIVVVATSGISDDDVERPAKRLQREGVKIIALGTQAASLQELQSIATDTFYYMLETPKDFLAFSQNMSNVIESVIAMANEVIPTTPPAMTTPPRIDNETTTGKENNTTESQKYGQRKWFLESLLCLSHSEPKDIIYQICKYCKLELWRVGRKVTFSS